MPSNDFSFSDFIASSIHDMKNSLMMQVGSLEALATRCQKNGDHQTAQDLGAVLYETHRMNANLVQLLSIYKFDKAIYPLDIQEHPVREVLTECLLQDKASLAFKGIEATVVCDDDLQWYLDRDLVTGILNNAPNNAYNYTQDKIQVLARVVDGMLELRVEDNGRGYPASMLAQHGLSKNREIDFAGGHTGLGLFFAQRAAELHRNGERQGAIVIENGGTLGGGCFVVRLP